MKTKPQTTIPVMANSRLVPGARRLSWYHLYFALAALDICTVVISLGLNHALVARYTNAVDETEAWTAHLNQFAQLRVLANAVNAPGNNVFDNRQAEVESARAQAALNVFEASYTELVKEVDSHTQVHDCHFIAVGLPNLQTAMAAMQAEAQKIFGFFRVGDAARAGERMASMDRSFAVLNAAIGDLEGQTRDALNRSLIVHRDNAQAQQVWEYFIGFLVLMMLGGVIWYGRRLSHTMEAAALERDEMQTGLREASRNAGMAEVAASVMHNIGNAITNANALAETLVERLGDSRLPNLAKATALIDANLQNIGGLPPARPEGPEIAGVPDPIGQPPRRRTQSLSRRARCAARWPESCARGRHGAAAACRPPRVVGSDRGH